MGLNKKDLALIDATHSYSYTVTIKMNAQGAWVSEVLLLEKIYPITTTRGDIKTWRSLPDALLFAQESCEKCKDIFVEFNGWIFARRK